MTIRIRMMTPTILATLGLAGLANAQTPGDASPGVPSGEKAGSDAEPSEISSDEGEEQAPAEEPTPAEAPPVVDDTPADEVPSKVESPSSTLAVASAKKARGVVSVDDAKKSPVEVQVAALLSAREYKPWEEIDAPGQDWVRTSSGEWLKGEIKELRDDDFRVDSDEFDIQTVDWPDVTDIHSLNRFTFVFDDQTVAVGHLDMGGGKLVVHTDEGPRVFDKKHLMTIIPESVSELSKWSFKLTLGASTSKGNTDSLDYTAYSRLRRKDAFNRITLQYRGAYGLVSDEVNTNRHDGGAVWNIFVSPVFYITPFGGDLLYDKFKNIAMRGIASAGVGFHALNKSDITLDFDIGAGYVTTRNISVEAGAEDIQHDMAIVPGIALDWDITSDVEFELAWKSALVVTTIENTFHQGSAAVSIEITDVFDFDVSAVYSRLESPVTDEDGNTPEKNDISTTVGIGLEFE